MERGLNIKVSIRDVPKPGLIQRLKNWWLKYRPLRPGECWVERLPNRRCCACHGCGWVSYDPATKLGNPCGCVGLVSMVHRGNFRVEVIDGVVVEVRP